MVGLLSYLAINSLDTLLEKSRGAGSISSLAKNSFKVGLFSFLYLNVVDASFSLDGVIGAFAITSNVVLIAAGLGIGALWVRSLTVYMVRRRMLGRYLYVEHGAHYTVLVLALLLLTSVVWDISNYVPGLIGMGIIGASVAASIQERRRQVMIHRDADHF